MSLSKDNIEVQLDLKAQQAEEHIHKLTKRTEELRKQNQEHRKEISRLAATEGDYSAEIKRLNESIRANSREIESNKRAIEAESAKVDLSRKTAAQLKKELRELNRQLNNTSKSLNPEKWRETEKEIQRYKAALQNAEKPTRSFLDRINILPGIAKAAEGALLAMGAAILNKVVNTFKEALNTIQDFERANSKLAAVLGTSSEGIAKLTEQAKYLGRTTTATASEVTGLQTELAKLGFNIRSVCTSKGCRATTVARFKADNTGWQLLPGYTVEGLYPNSSRPYPTG